MKIAFIGAGNMATAMIKGIINNGFVNQKDIFVSDKDSEKLKNISAFGVNTANDNKKAAEIGDIIVLAVKPNIIKYVLDEIKHIENLDKKIVVTIAAGISFSFVSHGLNDNAKVVRIMPNTPAMVSSGMTAVCRNPELSDSEINTVAEMCKTFGEVVIVDEKQIDAVTAVSGSGPAYIYMIIEAMADGGVLCGLPRDVAYTLAAQTVFGSAKMVMDTGLHPGALKDMVCSPGGTTIDAVYSLEKSGIRGAMIEAVKKCAEKSERLK